MSYHTVVPPGGEEEGGGEGGGKARGGDASAGASNGMSYLGQTTSVTGITSAPGRYVRSLQVQDADRLINSRGDSREIKVIGTPGAGFNLEINDSSGCSILEESLNQIGIPKSGIYKLKQKFPDITTSAKGGLVEENYNIVLTVNADSVYKSPKIDIDENSTDEEFSELIKEVENKPRPDYEGNTTSVTMYQYPDVTATITPSLTLANSSISGGTVTKTGEADGGGVETATSTWVITEDSYGGSGEFYVTNGNFNKNLTTNTMLKKVVSRPDGEFSRINSLVLKPSTTRVDKNGNITGDLEVGMVVYGKFEKTKIAAKSLEVPTCKRKTDKFSLSDTVGLFPGMTLEVPGQPFVSVVSVDCAKNITLDRKIIIRKNKKITFKHEVRSFVSNIKEQANSRGETCVDVGGSIAVVDGMELQFDDNGSIVSGSFKHGGSGSNTITLTSKINISRFGLRDVAYTWDLDKFISRTPNARDYEVVVGKNNTTGVSVNTRNDDFDVNSSSKVVSVTGQPNNGAATVSGGTITYVPNTSYVGDDKILFTISDAANASGEKEINITVK